MIFKKEAYFPYPVLSLHSTDYGEHKFTLDVSITEEGENYGFTIEHNCSSEYLNELLRNNKAKMTLIVQDTDTKIIDVNGHYFEISKNRISLNKKTKFQLYISASTRISFSKNYDLVEFYDDIKKNIFVNDNNVLAFSNVVIFNGDVKKPYEIIKYSIDEGMKTDIEIKLESEFINICYRDKKFKYNDVFPQTRLNYHYIYMGLQKALLKYVYDEGESEILIVDADDPESNLSAKLLELMKIKKVDRLSFENVDEVIYKISDDIIQKHVLAVRGLRNNAN